jgi:hypothetical protein
MFGRLSRRRHMAAAEQQLSGKQFGCQRRSTGGLTKAGSASNLAKQNSHKNL